MEQNLTEQNLIEQILQFRYSISELEFKNKLVELVGMSKARDLFLAMESAGLISLHAIHYKKNFVSRSDSYINQLIADIKPNINEQSPVSVISQYRYCTSEMSAACKWPYFWRVKTALKG